MIWDDEHEHKHMIVWNKGTVTRPYFVDGTRRGKQNKDWDYSVDGTSRGKQRKDIDKWCLRKGSWSYFVDGTSSSKQSKNGSCFIEDTRRDKQNKNLLYTIDGTSRGKQSKNRDIWFTRKRRWRWWAWACIAYEFNDDIWCFLIIFMLDASVCIWDGRCHRAYVGVQI